MGMMRTLAMDDPVAWAFVSLCHAQKLFKDGLTD